MDNPASTPLRILHVEDSPLDAALIQRRLMDEGIQYRYQRVDNEEDYLKALQNKPDLILADWHLPLFGGRKALQLLRAQGLDLPFVIVSGEIGEETTVDILRQGAYDFVLKDELSRLAPAIHRALADHQRAIQARRTRTALDILAEVQRRLITMNSLPDMASLVAEKVQVLLEDAIVVLMRFDEGEQTLHVQSVFGMDDLYERMVERFQGDPLAQTYYLHDMAEEHIQRFTSQRLARFDDGLYALATGKFPKDTCDAVEKLIAPRGIYTMGLDWSDVKYGGLVVFSRVDIAPYRETIETMMHLALTAMKRVHAQEALADSEQRLSMAIQAAGMGVWENDFLRNKAMYDETVARLLGIERQRTAPIDFWLRMVHPDDKPRLQKLIAARPQRPGQDITYEFRIVRSGGEIRWLQTTERVLLDHEGTLARAVGINVDITERKKRERMLEAQAMLAQALAETFELESLLERMLEAARHAVPGAEKGSIALLSGEKTLEVRSLSGYQDPRAAMFSYPVSWGYAGRSFRTQSPVLIQDVWKDDALHKDAASVPLDEIAAIRSAVAVPLKSKDRPLGVVALESSRPCAFGEDDVQQLSKIAGQIGLVIENAMLVEEMQRHLYELETVHEVSGALRLAPDVESVLDVLLQASLAVLHTDAGCVLLYDARDEHLHAVQAQGWPAVAYKAPISPGECLVGTVFSTGQAHVSPDLMNEPLIDAAVRESLPLAWGGAAIPLQGLQETVGVLFVAVPLPRRIEDDDLNLLESLTEMAGITLQRVRLLDETLAMASQLVTAHAYSRSLSETLDPNQVFTRLQEAVHSLFPDARDVRLHYLTGEAPLAPINNQGQSGKQALWNAFANSPYMQAIRQKQPMFDDETMHVPMLYKDRVIGVLQVQSQGRPFDAEDAHLLGLLANTGAIALMNANYVTELEERSREIALAYESTIEGWSKALELRDRETEGHTQRVTELTVQMARRLGLPEEQLVHIRRGALLHDIGKMGIPDAILNKPGELSPSEKAIMRRHPQLAYNMLAPIKFLEPALDIPYCHHERWDGAGYPRGLKGEEIPLAARIFAIADVFDALTSDRPYRKAFSKQAALDHIRAQAGKHFDPALAELFLEMMR